MTEEILHRRGNHLVRRLRLAPGEATPWHRDPYHRLTVVLSGDALEIEFRDGAESQRMDIAAGRADWDEPADRVHRAVNVGSLAYEEVTTFLLDRPDAVPQPQAEERPASSRPIRAVPSLDSARSSTRTGNPPRGRE